MRLYAVFPLGKIWLASVGHDEADNRC